MLTPEVRNYAIKLIKDLKVLHYSYNEYNKEIPLRKEIEKAEDPEQFLKEQFNNSGWVQSKNINGENIVISFDYQENGVKIIENFNNENEKEGFITYKRIADLFLNRSLF